MGTAEEVIAQFGCGTCHKVAGEAGEAGPDLTMVGRRGGKEFLRRSILSPDAEIAQGFEAGAMPPDFGDQVYAKELEMLVDYLAKLK